MRGGFWKNSWMPTLMLLAGMLVLGQPLQADVTGTILGTVTDPSSASVPGAKVTLRNPATGLVRETVTDASGNYEVLAVPVGQDYSIEVEAGGFRKSTQSGIKLLVNQRFRADFQLQVGTVQENVTVSANIAQVESSSTQLGDVIEDRKMLDLPLNNRNFADLLGLQAGVAFISGPAGNTGPGSGNAGAVSVNGSRTNANSFMVNGGSVEGVDYNNYAAIVPTLDSIQEFRLVTNSLDAEYGYYSGAVVNAITKSGTNQLHGDGFEFLRNEKLDSRNFFDRDQVDPLTGLPKKGTARGVFQRNQFGGTVGGPILKNRLFFFGDYQGTREIRGLPTSLIYLPSLTERSGDFSDLATTGYPSFSCVPKLNSPCTTGIVRGDTTPGAFPAYLSSKLGYTVTPGEPYWFPGADPNTGHTCATLADAQAGYCVFPGAAGPVIPQAAFNPAAKGTLKFFPNPIATLNGKPVFFTSALATRTRDDRWGARIDLVNKRTGNWSFYYHYDNSNVFSPSIQGFNGSSRLGTQQANVSNTHIFSPTTVNEARLNFLHTKSVSAAAGGLGPVSTWGWVSGGLGLIPENPGYAGVPSVGFGSGIIGMGAGGATIVGQNSLEGAENLSKISGKHTLKFGGAYRHTQWYNRYSGGNGSFGFYGGETGNDFADYLIGTPDAFVQSSGTLLDNRIKNYGLYAQDSYRARSNLTINYGLRWEVDSPFWDTQGKLEQFIPGQQSTVYPDSPTGWVFPGDKGVPQTLAPTPYRNFAPRLGFAYSPAATEGLLKRITGGPGKTSIRAAFGIFYTTLDTQGMRWEAGDAPYGDYYISSVPIYLDQPFKSRTSDTNDPGQRFPFPLPPTNHNISFKPYLPIAGSPAFEPTNKTPYTEDFNFTIQRELSTTTVLTLAYVGTAGHKLFTQQEFNPGNAKLCLQIRALLGPATGCGPFGADGIYTAPNGQTFYGTRPYSVTSGRYLSAGELDFSSNEYEATLGNSLYNSFQVTVNKTAGPLRFLGAYTWSKALDNASQMMDNVNPFNAKLTRSLPSFDVTHNFVVSYSYQLPFARLTSRGSGVVHGILAGWQLSGITRFSTGLPITLTESGDHSLCLCDYNGAYTNISVDFPNDLAGPIHFMNPRASANHQYFATDQFTPEEGYQSNPNYPILGVPGNANRRFFHGPGLNNWDVSLYKRTRITERVSLDIRAEFFNVFNHAQFYGVVGDFAAGTAFGTLGNARDPRIGQVAAKIHF